MLVKKLEIKNFRNFNTLHVEFNKVCNVFVGDNGQGKTNIIEAIYLLGRGSSFRPTEVNSYINQNNSQETGLVQAIVENDEKTSQITLQIFNDKKKFLINKKVTKTQSLPQQLPLILFSPESLDAIKGSSQSRRDLVDDLIILHQPENSQVIKNYIKILRNRNKLLRDKKEGLITNAEFNDVFESLNNSFLRAATDLTFLRINSLKNIKDDFILGFSKITKNKVELDLRYVMSSKQANTMSIQEIYNALYNRIEELRVAEISTGTSLVGPHRHDIQIYFEKKDSRYYCSQGQQRALILALKFSQIMYHYKVFQKYPVLLLDDVLSELDLGKKMNLLDLLGQIDAQVFVTSADKRYREMLNNKSYSVFEIDHGNIISRQD